MLGTQEQYSTLPLWSLLLFWWPPEQQILLWCKVSPLSLSPYAVSISLASAVIKETAANEQEQAYIIPRPSDNTPVFEIMFHLQTWLH